MNEKIEPSDQKLIDEWLSKHTIKKLPPGVSLDLCVKNTPAKLKRGSPTKKELAARAAAKRAAAIEDGLK
jgi:hypothetical protein